MATCVKNIQPHRRLGLSATPQMNGAQLSAGVVSIGQPVYIDTNGYIAATATDSVNSHSAVKAAASASIAGFLNDRLMVASSTSNVKYVPALPGMMFKGQLVDSTASSNAGALATIAQTDLGAAMGLVKLSGDTYYGVDKGVASSRDCVRVVELIDAVSTSGGMVGFIVRAAWRQIDV